MPANDWECCEVCNRMYRSGATCADCPGFAESTNTYLDSSGTVEMSDQDLQPLITALAEAKCSYGGDGKADWPDGRKGCLICNGSGLDPKYDCLREKCQNLAHNHGASVHYCYTTEERLKACEDHRATCPGYTVLPPGRAHEAVGKLLFTSHLDLQYLWQGDERHPLWTVNDWEKEIPYMSSATPEEALMAALCRAEGVSDG